MPTPEALLAFTKDLIKLRQTYPVLRRSRFLTGAHDETLDMRDLTWINANGEEMQQAHWNDASTKCLGMLIDGRAQKTGIRKRGDDATLLIVMNSYEGVVDFTLPETEGGHVWTLLIDSNMTRAEPDTQFTVGSVYQVTGRSLLLFVRAR